MSQPCSLPLAEVFYCIPDELLNALFFPDVVSMKRVTVVPAFPADEGVVGGVTWSLDPGLELEIATLAAICHDKQQQRTPLHVSTGAELEDWSNDETLASDEEAASTCAAALTGDVTKSSKMRFLDRLAEVFCIKKEADYVTCTSIITRPHNVLLLMARNAKWTEADLNLMKDIVSMMEQLVSQEISKDKLMKLCSKVAEHYAARLNYHLKALLGHLKQYGGTTRLLSSGYGMSCGAFADLNGFATLCQAACEVEGFKNIEVRLLTRHPPKKLFFNPKDLPSEVPPRQLALAYLAKNKWVHAEIRMVTYLLTHELFDQAFAYLGISRKICLPCGHIIKGLGRFNTRNNHGKIYSQWTVPSTLRLRHEDFDRWKKSVEDLRDALKTEAELVQVPYRQAVKESTITTPVAPKSARSTLPRGYGTDARTRELEANWLGSRMSPGVKTYRDFSELVVDVQHLAVEPPKGYDTTEPKPSATGAPRHEEYDILAKCVACHARGENFVQCSKCQSVFYCGLHCLRKHWPYHRFHCLLGRPLDEADELAHYCHQKEPQVNDRVAESFGFLHFEFAEDRLRLFRLYCKLIELGVNDDELRQAWRTDQLRQFILARGSQLPRNVVGNLLEWFRLHRDFAANSRTTHEQVSASLLKKIGLRECDMLGLPSKQHAFENYLQIVTGYAPTPDHDSWLALGFCTARTPEQTHQILRSYQKLVSTCKFEQFEHAMEKSTMIELFAKCGLTSEIATLHNFQVLMKTVGKWHQSVWELKRSTLLSEAEPMRAVLVDYGFGNRLGPNERMHLRNVYSRYFAAGLDEMDLHQACIEGDLSRFLESALGEPHGCSPLLRNPYPLAQCSHMGLVADQVAVCRESDYAVVSEKLRADGEAVQLWMVPDDCDVYMQESIRDRAAKVTGMMRIEKAKFEGHTILTMSSDKATE